MVVTRSFLPHAASNATAAIAGARRINFLPEGKVKEKMDMALGFAWVKGIKEEVILLRTGNDGV